MGSIPSNQHNDCLRSLLGRSIMFPGPHNAAGNLTSMADRAKLFDKIRALLAKTTERGCTEAEALAALDKARAMMDAYEVTEADLQLTRDEAAVLHRTEAGNDPHHTKRGLYMAVARFCDCEGWLIKVRRNIDQIVFCGMPSDVQFAAWLTDSLALFVQEELAISQGQSGPEG
jgi:hypothetical protein